MRTGPDYGGQPLTRWAGRGASGRRSAAGRSAPVAATASRGFAEGLDLEVLLEADLAHLAADAALLVAAEGDVRAVVDAAVDDHRAGTDPAGHPLRPLVVAGEDGAGQAEDGVVRD